MFCRKCGIELPDDSVFCTRCGTATQAGAQQAVPVREYIDVFEGVTAKDTYDLYVCDTRLVMIKTHSGTSHGGFLSPVTTAVEAGVKRATRRKEDGVSLDQKVRRYADNFIILYADVKTVRLGRGKLGGRIFQVRYADSGDAEKKLDIAVSSEQFEKLSGMLPAIPLLASKFQVKVPEK